MCGDGGGAEGSPVPWADKGITMEIYERLVVARLTVY